MYPWAPQGCNAFDSKVCLPPGLLCCRLWAMALLGRMALGPFEDQRMVALCAIFTYAAVISIYFYMCLSVLTLEVGWVILPWGTETPPGEDKWTKGQRVS